MAIWDNLFAPHQSSGDYQDDAYGGGGGGGFDTGQGLQGAAGGAMTGAALGSVVPGIGTAVGAVGGALLGGLMGGSSGDPGARYRNTLNRLSQGYGKRQAPQMGPAQQAAQSGFRGNQASLISQLEQLARGNGPSLAQLQMQDAMDRASGAQMAGAATAGGRGVNVGAATRQAMNNTAAQTQQAAKDTGMMRVQEQMDALKQLGGVTAQGRAADEALNQFNAEQQNRNSYGNMEAKLRMLGLNDEAQLRALMGALGSAPTPMGTSLLAGGASAIPSWLSLGGKGGGGSIGGGLGSAAAGLRGGGGGWGAAGGAMIADPFNGGPLGSGPNGQATDQDINDALAYLR